MAFDRLSTAISLFSIDIGDYAYTVAEAKAMGHAEVLQGPLEGDFRYDVLVNINRARDWFLNPPNPPAPNQYDLYTVVRSHHLAKSLCFFFFFLLCRSILKTSPCFLFFFGP